MREAFALHFKSFSQFFNKSIYRISDINASKFSNETFTNEVVSFEQPGPDVQRNLSQDKIDNHTMQGKSKKKKKKKKKKRKK